MSTTVVPTSTSVQESSLIPAHLSQVWHLIKLQSFHHFWTALSSSEEVKGSSPETDIVRWTFKDGTVQDVKLEESSLQLTSMHELQSLNHYITYSIISSAPALTYTSALSTVRCFEVTSGPHAGATFVQWSGYFSGDADAGVIEDAKFKRREALADLAKAVAGKGTGKMT